MSRLAWSTLFAICVAALSWSCSNGTNPTTTPSAPTTTQVFGPSAVNINGAQVFGFNTAAAGTITATITAIDPALPTGAAIGMAIGTFSANGCAVVIANDAAGLGTSVVGNANGVSSFCVRVYDVGKLTATENVTVTVVHP